MKYPDHTTYAALYAKYYSGRDVGELLDLLEPLKDKRVLDLCGGEGRLSIAAVKRGAREVILVDSEDEMMPKTFEYPVYPHVIEAETYLHYQALGGWRYDRIACRQAANYWLTDETAELAAKVLPAGGIFAFNTFNEKPPEKPRVKEYDYDGHSFVEISWLVGDMVHHVQVRDGMAPHTTVFKWLPRETLHSILAKYFHVHEIVCGKTSLYKCVKK